MFLVVIACIPGICSKCYFFGCGTLIQVLSFIALSFLSETILVKVRAKSFSKNVKDNSGIVTALLLGVSVPPLIPWWMIVIGVFFSIVVAKHLYGGLGQNIFNPAMIGYAVLLISFPLHMSNWIEKNDNFLRFKDIQNAVNIIFTKNTNINNTVNVQFFPDCVTQATPLNHFKNQTHLNYDNVIQNTINSNQQEIIKVSWICINISFLIGGLFLIYKKVICWRIPFSILLTLCLCSSINYFFLKNISSSPLVHLFSGGTMICAFFIATDPVTTACTNIGRIIFGILVGFLVYFIRNYSDYPDSIAFAVLFSNMITPLIDYYIRYSGYGHKRI